MDPKGIRITVTSSTVDGVLDRIERLAENPAEIMSEISAFMVQRAQRHIETETGPDGKWPELSPRTAERRIGGKRRGYRNKLRVSNRLYNSLTGDYSATEAVAGSNAIQAAIQQLGGDIKVPEREQTIYQNYDPKTDTFDPRFRRRSRSNFSRTVKVGAHTIRIPARPYLYLDETDFAEIETIAAAAFEREAQQ